MAIAGCADWAPEERQAIRELEQILWTRTLATYPSDVDAEDLLFAIGLAEPDLTPHLNEWTASLRQPAAAAHLADLQIYAPELLHSMLGPVEPPASDLRQQMLRWSISPEVRRAVAEAVDFADSEEALQVLVGIDGYFSEYDEVMARQSRRSFSTILG